MPKQSVEQKKPQQRIYTDGEMNTIRNNFKDNEALMKAVRKVMLQMPLQDTDQAIIDSVKLNQPLVALLRKCFLPTLDPNAPFGQVIDLWMTVTIKEKSPDQAFHELVGRDILIDYLDQQLKKLEGLPVSEPIVFKDLIQVKEKEPSEVYANFMARNTCISHLELQLMTLKAMAEQSEETPDELKKRLGLNSNK